MPVPEVPVVGYKWSSGEQRRTPPKPQPLGHTLTVINRWSAPTPPKPQPLGHTLTVINRWSAPTPPKPQPLGHTSTVINRWSAPTPPKSQPRGGRTFAAVLSHSLRSFPAVLPAAEPPAVRGTGGPSLLASPAPASRLPLWVPPHNNRTSRLPSLVSRPPRCSGRL